ncbi:MAG TPA: serine/threonine-protein kinase [Kofleriaceae bacterium]|nr:serine/threonine-protein kinase [Kofleriaceae bacterium]
MQCPDDNALVAMADHGLPTAQFAHLEEHIDGCESCRKIVAAALASRSLAVGTPRPPSGNDVAEALVGTLDVSISDRYVVEAVLGKGGMGTVYLAHDKTLGRDVALKLHHRADHAGAAERLRREAMAMAKLAHPNVVTVFEVATVDERLYVAMEYVRGETLRGWLAQKKRSWREIIALLVEAGQGLAAAHDAGLIHRDFKPENVLVGDDGRPRVGDFGLARVGAAPASGLRISGSGPQRAPGSGPQRTPTAPPSKSDSKPGAASGLELADTALTKEGTVLGTPAYMAPEQLSGAEVDARCDQFAFAVVAWECLYGKRPFAGMDREKRAEAPRSDVPVRVRRVLERGLAIDPAARFADMPALLAALRTSSRPRTAQWIAASLAGVAVIGGVAYAGAGMYRDRERHAACELEGDRVASVLRPEQQVAIRMSFLATRSPMADGAYEHAMSVLTPYAKSLGAKTTQACLTADEPMHAARARCLSARKNRLATLADGFAHATKGKTTVSRAAEIAWNVAHTDPCSDEDPVLTERKHAPTDPVLAKALDDVYAVRDAGKYDKELEAATALLAKARAAGDRETELDALLAQAMAQDALEKPERAKTFDEVAALAEALGRDVTAAGAYATMAANAARDQQDFTAAHRYLGLARAKLDRLGGKNIATRGDLFIIEAKIFMDEYRWAEGEAAGRQGVALLEQALGPNHPKVGIATGTWSQLLRMVDKNDEALAQSERTLDIFTKAYGADHPTTAGSSLNLAQSLIDAKRYDEARERLLSADKVFMRTFGPNHPVHISAWSNLATVEQLQEHWDLALSYDRRVLAMMEALGGPDSADASGAHRDIAKVLALSNHPHEALAEQQRAVSILEKLGEDGEGRMIGAQVELGEMQLELGNKSAAKVSLHRVLDLAAKHPNMADPVLDVKRAQELLAYAEGRTPMPGSAKSASK